MAFDLFDNWNLTMEKSRQKRDKEYWGNPENRWENQDRTPLSFLQDALDWEEMDK